MPGALSASLETAAAAVPHGRPVLFYGVNSEGMGHATRSLPLIEALSERYEIHVFCGGRALDLFGRYFSNIHDTWHVRLCYSDNTLLLRRSFFCNLARLPGGLRAVASVLRLGRRLRPLGIITDFEPTTCWMGRLLGIKVISIDNQHMLRYGALPRPKPEWQPAARAICRAMALNIPAADITLISSFYQPPLREGTDTQRVRYVPSAARAALRSHMGHSRTDGPVLVYQTSPSNQDLASTLRGAAETLGLSFRVYGASGRGEELSGRVTYHPFSEEGFLSDMARAPFVIVNGGHSTICEALALGKPVLAEPIRENYEQAVNVHGLETLGVGAGTSKLCVDDILHFSLRAPLLRVRAQQLRPFDNDGLIQAVEEALWNTGA